MKQILFIIGISAFFFSCTQAQDNADTQEKIQIEDKSGDNNTDEAKIIHLTTAEFKKEVFDYSGNEEWKYLGDKPAIIDFYADWCRPCKMVAPTLEELQKEYAGKIQIYKVNVDHEKELSQVFQTSSIPSFLFVPMKGQPQMAKGLLPKETFENVIKDVLNVK